MNAFHVSSLYTTNVVRINTSNIVSIVDIVFRLDSEILKSMQPHHRVNVQMKLMYDLSLVKGTSVYSVEPASSVSCEWIW